MLKEIKATSQKRGEPKRRWFSGSNMDLFVWFNDDGGVVSYQLTYNKPHAEKALTWSEENGFSHLGVDDGTRPGKHPGSPLLVKGVEVKPSEIISILKKNSGGLDHSIKKFIVSGIEEYYR